MENNKFATASSGATASETELDHLIAASDGNGSTDVVDETTEEETEDAEDGPTREERWDRNRELRRQFLECNLRIQQAQAAGDHEAETVARRERDRIGDEFVKANHGLAVKGARPMLIGKPEDRADHVQSALLGMWEALVGTKPDQVDDVVVDENGTLRAASGWDPSQGTFGNYSGTFIRGAARRSVRRTEVAYMGMSYNAWSDRPKIERARAELVTETGRAPSVKEIAARAGVTEETVHTVLTAAPVSLDKPVGEDGDTTLGDLVADQIAELGADDIELLRDHLVDRAQHMGVLDMMVFLLHTGAVIGRPSRSMVQTADKLGIGRGAVQLAYKRAVAALHSTEDAPAPAAEAAATTEPVPVG